MRVLHAFRHVPATRNDAVAATAKNRVAPARSTHGNRRLCELGSLHVESDVALRVPATVPTRISRQGLIIIMIIIIIIHVQRRARLDQHRTTSRVRPAAVWGIGGYVNICRERLRLCHGRGRLTGHGGYAAAVEQATCLATVVARGGRGEIFKPHSAH